jgi:hypothetical protein
MLPLHVHQKKAMRMHWNTNNVVTLIAAGLSVLLILVGGRHCYIYGYSYLIDCSKDVCTHKSSISGVPITQFARENIVGAETVRVNGIEVVDTVTMEESGGDTSKLGYSFLIKYTDKDSNGEVEDVKTLLFTPHNLGKRIAKARTHDIHDFAEGFLDKIRINQGRQLTSLGALLGFMGFLSISMVAVLGTWPELPVFIHEQKFL